MENLIVSKNPAEVEFIKQMTGLPESTRVIQDPLPADVAGNVVYGNLPFELAALTQTIFMVQYPLGQPPIASDYKMQDMIDAGARLRAYAVRTIGWVEARED